MKKIISILMSFELILVILLNCDYSVYAVNKSQAEAVNWANSKVGQSVDYDGVYGAQCVDLIKYYYKYLGVSPVSGNGCDYANNTLPSGWQRIKYYSGFSPKPGDVAVWTYASSSYGHVAIITSATTSYMNVVEQNGSTGITRTHQYNYSYGTFFGVIRPDFKQETAPTYSYISADKLNYRVNENVNFTFNTDGSTNTLWVYCPDGSTLHYSGLGDKYSLAFGMSGYFEGLVETWNGVGSKCSQRISWYVGIPQYAYIYTDKTSYYVNETINFTFNTACRADYNTLWIYFPDGTTKYYQKVGTKYSVKLSQTGTYKALVEAWNDVGSKQSEKITFTVKAKNAANPTVTQTTWPTTSNATTESATSVSELTSTSGVSNITITQPTTILTTTNKSIAKSKSTTIKKLKSARKAVTLEWKKVSGVKGYQIQVATDKKFKKNKRTVTIKKQKTNKASVKKLKAKKKYYVRIRTYKTVNGKKIYSSWSKVKRVKTK